MVIHDIVGIVCMAVIMGLVASGLISIVLIWAGVIYP